MRNFLFIIILLSFIQEGKSQDRHYWSQMGGITAGLLGGSGMAGLKDNSTMYYNPAAMSFVNNPSVSLGANTYRLRILKIDNAFGQDLNKFNMGFIINPGLIGGLLFSKRDDRLRFGYAVVNRFSFINFFSAQSSFVTDSDQTLVKDFNLDNKMRETWLNFAVSNKFSEHFSFGLSLIIAFRTQFYSNYIGAKIIPSSPSDAVSRFDSRVNYNYWNVKGLLRLSIALDYERFRFGWNVTLPSINFFGKANVVREFGLVNNPNILNDLPTDIIISSSAKKIPAVNKYPFSSAIGVSFKINKSDWIHFSTELFLPINRYQVLSSDIQPIAFPEEAIDSISSKYFQNINFLELYDQAKFVINFSVGYEGFITEHWGPLVGLRTDFNFNDSDDFDLGELRPYYSKLNIYYISGGVWGIIKTHKITTGIEIGLTPTTQIRQLINFDGIDSPDYPLLGTPEDKAQASQLVLRLFLGIEINFNQKAQNRKLQ